MITRMAIRGLVLAGSVLLSACSASGGTGNEGEFVQACLTTQATQAICECAAKAAKSAISDDHFHMMVLDMQGKKQELDAMAEKLSLDQRAAFAQEQFGILGKCADVR